MNYFKNLLAFGVLVAAVNAQAVNSSSGRVVCSLAKTEVSTHSFEQQGFVLVSVGKKDRPYLGSYRIGNLQFQGSYLKESSRLVLEVQSVDEEGDILSQVLLNEVDLVPGSNLHTKITRDDFTADIYCNVVFY